ncbi:MAG: accessory factor UbiK family protein [Gammaproteobacteria bacterium]
MEHLIQLIQTRLSTLMPQGFTESGAEFSDQLKQVLREALQKLDLVTRDEFNAQQAVLRRTQERLHRLEARVKSLEAGDAE